MGGNFRGFFSKFMCFCADDRSENPLPLVIIYWVNFTLLLYIFFITSFYRQIWRPDQPMNLMNIFSENTKFVESTPESKFTSTFGRINQQEAVFPTKIISISNVKISSVAVIIYPMHISWSTQGPTFEITFTSLSLNVSI